MLAVHGNEIFAAAQKQGVMVAFEAAVAGGVPIIKALREGLTANRIEWIAGIINGTSNFILSEMREKGLGFDEVLKEAQARGYAEADPTFDVEGIDAAHKLTILSAIAFGIPMQFDRAYMEGISKLTREDIRYAESLGYRIKLLGITKLTRAGDRAARAPDARPGAPLDRERRRRDERDSGEGRRGRADDVLRRRRRRGADGERGGGRPRRRDPPAHRRPGAPRAAPRVPAGPARRDPHPADGRGERPRTTCACASRTSPGVLADITRILADRTISIDAMIQSEPAEGEDQVDIIMLTHETQERNLNAAIIAIEALPVVVGHVTRIRLEELGRN